VGKWSVAAGETIGTAEVPAPGHAPLMTSPRRHGNTSSTSASAAAMRLSCRAAFLGGNSQT